MNELLGLLKAQKQLLDNDLSPAGYNIGINDGIAAGQTVMHLHIHLIPRYAGDDPDLREAGSVGYYRAALPTGREVILDLFAVIPGSVRSGARLAFREHHELLQVSILPGDASGNCAA
jgi:hypothetical protein